MLISKFSNKNVQEKVANIESKYKITLPLQYKKFLYKYNGGYTPKTKLKVGKVSTDVRSFFGVGDVKVSIDDIDLQKWIEIGVFPIATDSFGNYIVLNIKGNEFANIYFCDHEKNSKKEFIASDIKELFDVCKSEKISETSKLSIEEREAALISRGKGNNITDALREMWQAEINKYAGIIQENVDIEE